MDHFLTAGQDIVCGGFQHMSQIQKHCHIRQCFSVFPVTDGLERNAQTFARSIDGELNICPESSSFERNSLEKRNLPNSAVDKIYLNYLK